MRNLPILCRHCGVLISWDECVRAEVLLEQYEDVATACLDCARQIVDEKQEEVRANREVEEGEQE